MEYRREGAEEDAVVSQDYATNEEMVADDQRGERADTVDETGVRLEVTPVDDPKELVLGFHDEMDSARSILLHTPPLFLPGSVIVRCRQRLVCSSASARRGLVAPQCSSRLLVLAGLVISSVERRASRGFRAL